jgi:hypothetical protein
VSHIPQFGDATTSSAGDVDVNAGDAVSPAGALLASANLGICDTNQLSDRSSWATEFSLWPGTISINYIYMIITL